MAAEAKRTFTVLVVDDCATTRAIIGNTLSAVGYHVVSAITGAEAMEKAQTMTSPDLILLDIMLPDGDGFEILGNLRCIPQTSQTPVIFLTGMTDIETKIKAFHMGAVDYIIKPFHPEEVKIRVSVQIRLGMANRDMIQRQRDNVISIESHASKLSQIRDAQESILVQPERVPDAKFQVYCKMLQEAGGDFYDVLPVAANTYGYFVADVSGHDVGTSFITASVKALLRQNCSALYSPLESMRNLNSVLVEVLPMNKYITANYFALNRKNGQVICVTMGHPPLVKLNLDGKVEVFENPGDVMGMFPNPTLTELKIRVKPGERLFLLSDGILECGNVNWTEGMGILVSQLEKMAALPLNEIVRKLPAVMAPDPQDDVVLLGVEV